MSAAARFLALLVSTCCLGFPPTNRSASASEPETPSGPRQLEVLRDFAERMRSGGNRADLGWRAMGLLTNTYIELPSIVSGAAPGPSSGDEVSADRVGEGPRPGTGLGSFSKKPSWRGERPSHSVTPKVAAIPGRAGLTVRERHEIEDGNGAVIAVGTRATEYDSRGYPGRILMEEDDDANGTVEHRTRVETDFDGRGLVTEIRAENDMDANGSADDRYLVRFLYDERGNLSRRVEEHDVYADGTVDERQVWESLWNENGTLLSEVRTVDSNADGAFDVRYSFEGQYDAHRNLVRAKYVTEFPGFQVFASTLAATFDSRGDLLSYVFESDANDDGSIDYRETTRVTWEQVDQTRVGVLIFDQDIDANGQPEARTTGRYVFDQQGNRLGSTEDQDQGVDGVVERRSVYVASYDPHGQLLRDTSQEFDGSGTFLFGATNDMEWNARGDLVSLRFEIDYPAPTPSYVTTQQFSYDSRGRLTGGVTRYDVDGDGVSDGGDRYEVLYEGTGAPPRPDPLIARAVPAPRLAASPNPSRGRSILRFSLARPGNVELRIHDVRGRVVRTLVAGQRSTGEHRVEWDGMDESGRRAPSGAYFARLRREDGITTLPISRFR